jgi:hypothetical protein
MNIFYLHNHPTICAIYHNDKHVVKMILETTQLLYTCLHLSNPELISSAPMNKAKTRNGYKPTHKNHPSSLWTRKSISNYNWLCSLGIELCREYTYRYNKIHTCQQHLQWLSKQIPLLPNIPFTEPTPAMPEEYKQSNSILSYRNYYIHEKAHFCKWSKRNVPHWFK